MATGIVKWYDPEKGYGFIAPDGGRQDLFVHRSAVSYEGLNEGDKIDYEIGYGQKGANALRVTVTERSALPARPRRNGFGASERLAGYGLVPDGGGDLPQRTDVVKRFDPDKGFEFIAPDGGGEDVFVHRSALGYETIVSGDRVEFRLGQGAKGARAEQVRVVERTGPSTHPGRQSDWSGGYDDLLE